MRLAACIDPWHHAQQGCIGPEVLIALIDAHAGEAVALRIIGVAKTYRGTNDYWARVLGSLSTCTEMPITAEECTSKAMHRQPGIGSLAHKSKCCCLLPVK